MPTDKDKINSAAALLGRKGGLARAKSLTAEERRQAASKAAKARWSKRGKKNGKSP